jgi:phosphatidylserine/phosphatidylglycerophosphate/cardiolipin synthase-like enzyme
VNFRRVLLLVDLEAAAGAGIDIIRRVAPDADLLLIVARLSAGRVAWFSAQAPPDLNAAATKSLDALRSAASGLAKSVEIRVEPEFRAGDLAVVAEAAGIDLLVTGSLPEIALVRRQRPLAVLWTADHDHPGPDREIANVLCVALGERSRRAVGRFLRDHGSLDLRVTALVQSKSRDVASLLKVAGIRATVKQVTRTPAGPFDLVVLARAPGGSRSGAFLAAQKWRAPVLILPPLESGPPSIERAMDVADAIDQNGVIRLRAHYALGVGRLEPIPDQTLAIVSGGRVVATIATEDGAAELTPAPQADTLGIYRTAGRGSADPLTSIEQNVAVIRPGSRPLILFDSNARQTELRHLSGLDGIDLLAVRMRVTESCSAIRARLRRGGLPERVIDARAVLDEGAALDVGDDLDPVRLARVATRMRADGFSIAAIVHRGALPPTTVGFAALRADQLAANLSKPISTEPLSPGRSLEATTGAPRITGNRVEIELDNEQARRWLLEAIAAAKRRVHFQIYMALDDDVGRAVEAALAAAGARGVTVRVVVDSLHGFHGSLGAHNPLLERLGGRPGVELRVLDPITSPPSLQELKQRDHRKLAVIDGDLALLGGRNLSHEYYTGFDEMPLTARSLWREVPWLDAGARVEGPAVAALDRSFLEAWTAAGGSAFEITEPPPAGAVAVRLVIHHGLREARTLDAYIAMIDAAQSHVYTVNGFPLILEVQHALLRALRRGVRVRTLFGNLTPTHDGAPFHGPWSSARTEATSLVHSRMDALVAAGAEAYEFVVPEQPVWERGLGAIHPHVHAKVTSIDGRVCSVGSANLDVTAGYWENELVLIVEDPPIAAALETHIDRLLDQSHRVDRHDPEWQRLAKRREWMRRWPGVMSV